MDESLDKIIVLEQKTIAFLNKYKQKTFELSKLEAMNNQLLEQNKIFIDQIQKLKSENQSLKMANSLLGSKEGKASTQHKINRLIKEVDFCIHQLTEINTVYE